MPSAMRIVIASDKWRGSFTSAEAGRAIAAGVRGVLPDADVLVLPLADRGEGTLVLTRAAPRGARRSRP